MERATTVTVAICTWNRCGLLAQTLEQITELSVSSAIEWELLVVDNNSTDDTQLVLRQFLGRLPLRLSFEAIAGKSHAANRAMREARGDWIAWIDDDVLVDRNWLNEFTATASRFPAAAVIGGPIDPWFAVPPDPAILDAFPIARRGFCGLQHGADERVLSDQEQVYGANMAFRMAAVKGLSFDADLGPSPFALMTGEEAEFLLRVRANGGQLVWSPKMRVKHYVDPARMTLGYLTRYHADHARTLMRLGTMPREFMPPAPLLFGVPRWLWRSTASAYLRWVVARAQRGPGALVRLREYWFFRGMLVEYRERHRHARAA